MNAHTVVGDSLQAQQHMIQIRFGADSLRRNDDPREVPAYSIPVAAHYLRIPVSTLRSWVRGRSYATRQGKQTFWPLIMLPDSQAPLLSFYNLAEAHVLSAFRKAHQIRLHNIRQALGYVAEQMDTQHPLIDAKFETDGASLFVQQLDNLVDASARGQLAIREVLDAYLQRIDRDGLLVTRLWPFTRTDYKTSPKAVFIDPQIAFGRPVLAISRVPTDVLAERYLAGDSIEHLAKDYRCAVAEVEEALRCELRQSEAA